MAHAVSWAWTHTHDCLSLQIREVEVNRATYTTPLDIPRACAHTPIEFNVVETVRGASV